VPAFQAPKGTFDVLPPESAEYARLISNFAAVVQPAGYGLVVSPMFEDVAVFQRVGESTDVVRKEMYEFEDKGGRHLALRPEGTASVVRAWIEHRPPLPFKAWYAAPSFRYEAPQAGRYRQHHQLGVEALGTDDPDLDVEVITLLADFLASIGVQRITLRLTSLGDDECRPSYRQMLGEYLDARRDVLCRDHRARYDNPLRVLDCKKPECVAATADAPVQVEHLCAPCQAHFERVKDGLAAAGVDYVIDRRLVRGFDYYTRTTFEVAADDLDIAQNGIAGGGRYDGLVEALGGPPTAGIGFGAGIERLLLAAPAQPPQPIDVFVVDTAGGAAARDLSTELRRSGVSVDRAWGDRSLKAQMRLADRSHATVALVVGPDETARGVVAIKHMTGEGQKEVDRHQVVERVKELLNR
jgi:histidyl-tRNA synthetase